MNDPSRPAADGLSGELAAAVARLRSGGLVAFPTETVYGLGADAFNPAAVDRVFAAKGRPASNPLIVHVTGPEMARRVAAAWPERAEKLARAFWPGPLTLVLPRRGEVPERVAAGGSTVAVRAPDHPTATALLFAFGGPLVGPSANRSGRVSPTTAAHVREAFGGDEVMTLEGGTCSTGIESSVVRLDGPRVSVLRPGVVTAGMIESVLGERVDGPAQSSGAAGLSNDGVLASPGLLDVHYAPVTPAFLFDVEQWPVVVAACAARSGVVLTVGDRGQAPSGAKVMAMPTGARAYAAAMYRALREADADVLRSEGTGAIYVERPGISAGTDDDGETGIWMAVLDRLRRATRNLEG